MENDNRPMYRMSLRIKSDGYKVSVSDNSGMEISSKRVTAALFKMPHAEIEATLAKEFSVNVDTVRIYFDSDVYTFVPTALFDPNEIGSYLAFQHKIAKNDRVVYNSVPSWDTVNVFSIPNNLLTALMKLVPLATIEHHMSAFLNENVLVSSQNEMHIKVRSKMIDLIVVKHGRLFLLNSFACQTADDYVYHTMNTVEQINIDTDNYMFYLYEGAVNAEVEKQLSNYLAIVSR